MNLRKFPVVLQDETFECGLACMAAIAQHHGCDASLENLRRRFDVTSSGLTLYHLIKVAATFGMTARGVKLNSNELGELRLPAILLWNSHHFVVLCKVSATAVEIMDPSIGLRRFRRDEAADRFSGAALEIVATKASSHDATSVEISELADLPVRKFSYGWLQFCQEFFLHRRYLVPLIVFGLCVQAISIISPKIVSLAIDEVLNKNDSDFLYLLLYIFGLLFFFQSLAGYLKSAVARRLRIEVSTTHGANIVQSLLAMPLLYFNRRSHANLLRKIKAIDSIHIAYTNGYIEIGIGTLSLVAAAFFMLAINALLGILLVASALAFLFVRHMNLIRLKSLMFSSIDYEIRCDMQILGALRSIRTLKLKGLTFVSASNWMGEHASLESSRAELDHSIENLRVFATAVSSAQMLLLIGFGSLSVMNGELSAGSLISLLFYKTLLMDSANTIAMSQVRLHLAKIEMQRLQDIVPLKIENPLTEGYSECPGKVMDWQESRLENVSFGYTNLDAPVLRNIYFNICYGHKVCVRGPSGTGKSTLVNLICGLLRPTSGNILVNGIALQRQNEQELQKAIAVCSSEDEIINGTVIDNIVFGSVAIDIERLESAIESAGMRSMISQLTHGLNTRLGASGANLSSGQRQRVVLARALYQNPRLLILDEPTSHLDDENAEAVITSLKKLSIAVLVITHDIRVEAVCKRRYLLRSGELREIFVDEEV